MRQQPFFILPYFLFIFLIATVTAHANNSGFNEQVKDTISRQLLPAGPEGGISICRECVYDQDAVRDFYLSRHFIPAWSTDGKPGNAAHDLVRTIRESGEEGLIPDHYHRTSIETLMNVMGDDPSVEQSASLDLLLTDAFLVLGSHFLNGRINPATIDPEWQTRRREGDLLQSLRRALADNNVIGELQALLPHNPIYAGLRQALVRYREIAAKGPWPKVPEGAKLEEGDTSQRVVFLRQRLVAENDFVLPAGQENFFDKQLAEAVRRFQARHGLDTDAVVGRNTLAALNVPVTERVRQIELNLERWRWLPQDLGQRYIIVNIAAFELTLMESNKPVLPMRVVVGRPYRRTPVFSGVINSLVLNPTWEVPTSIAAKDLLPKIKKDSHFLASNNYRLFSGWNSGAREVDPSSVNWGKVREGTFPFRLRQDPGPHNALGRVKFLFPNPHDVYLHDTPSRSLFNKDMRTFSSGCIRLEKPLDLAIQLLRGTPLADREFLDEALATGRTQTIRLIEKVQLHLLYWTAWADDVDTVHFRNDIYGRDLLLWQAMQQPPPRLVKQAAAEKE